MGGLKFLTLEQKKFYDDNGFIKLGGVFTDQETESISKAYDDLFERKTKESHGAGMESSWVGQRISPETGNVDYTAKGIHNLQMHSAEFTKVITHPKLLDAVEDIMGTEDILLHHTKAHVKPPGKGAPYPMHQDYHYFPFRKDTMLAVFLHLDDTTPENGGLAVYPGSHKLGPQEDKGLVDDSGKQYHWVDQERFSLSGATPVEAKRGEIIVFSYLLVHGSYMNLSDRTRRMFLIQLRAADDEPTIICHLSPAQNLVLRGNNVFCSAAMATRYDRVQWKKFYKDNGFIKLSGIFTDQEMEAISKAYNDLFERKNKEDQGGLESAWVGDRVKQEAGYIDYTVKSIHNLQMHSAEFTGVITHPKLLDAVEDLLGIEDILLHHTKAHIKPTENGAPYLMHQDYPYFPFKNHTMMAVFLHPDDTTPENGGLAVYLGSHKLGPLEDHGNTDKNGEEYHWVDQDRFPLSGPTPVEAKKGDLAIFSYQNQLKFKLVMQFYVGALVL